MYSIKVLYKGRVLYLSYDTHSAASMVYYAIRASKIDEAYLIAGVKSRNPRGHVLNEKPEKLYK
jgi:hypothetical protein